MKWQEGVATTMVRKRARRTAIGFGSGLLMLAAVGGPAMTTESMARPGADATAGYSALRLVADISERQLHVTREGETIATYQVAVGKSRNPTPRGTFTIRRLVWNPAWVPPDAPWARGKKPREPWHPANPMKTVKIFFSEPDYYIHGTGDTESLGTAASHGCLRMSPSDVAEVAKLVMEHGGVEREESWFERVIGGRETRVVRLPRPVVMSVVE